MKYLQIIMNPLMIMMILGSKLQMDYLRHQIKEDYPKILISLLRSMGKEYGKSTYDLTHRFELDDQSDYIKSVGDARFMSEYDGQDIEVTAYSRLAKKGDIGLSDDLSVLPFKTYYG